MELVAAFRAAVRAAVGLSDVALPEIDRLAFYECEVISCVDTDDGVKVDLHPYDNRLDEMQGVKIKLGLAGAKVLVSAGAKVLVGWERGDPQAPYVASWTSAHVTKMELNADALELAGNAYHLPRWDTFVGQLTTFLTSAKVATTAAQIATAANVFDNARATDGNWTSAKVKNG